jgi:hypothetical protein
MKFFEISDNKKMGKKIEKKTPELREYINVIFTSKPIG